MSVSRGVVVVRRSLRALFARPSAFAGIVLSVALPWSTWAEAQSSAPISLEEVALWDTPFGAELEVIASATPRWTLRYDEDGGFILRLPGSTPEAGISDLAFDEGLVRAVRVRLAADLVEPSTLIEVSARRHLRVSVRPTERVLRVLLYPVESFDAGAGEPPAAPLEETPEMPALGGSTHAVGSSVEPCLNLRAEPGGDSRLDCLQPGTRIAVIELRGEWSRVRLPDGRGGWAASRFLEPVSAVPAGSADLAEAQAETAAWRARAETAEAYASESAQRLTELEQRLAESETALLEATARGSDLSDPLATLEVGPANHEIQSVEPARRPTPPTAARVGEGDPVEPSSKPPSPVVRTLIVSDLEPQPHGSIGEPEPVATPSRADDSGVRERVLEWARAWSAQQIDDYLAFYADAFTPASGIDHRTWVSERRARLSSPTFIEVQLAEITLEVAQTGSATVHFTQYYRSDTFSDVVGKTLVLVQEGGAWKIASEASLPAG